MNEHILCMPHCTFKSNIFPEMVIFFRDVMGFQELFTLTHTQRSLERTKQDKIRKVGDVWIKYFKIAPNRFIELFDEPYEKLDFPGDYSYQSLCIEVEDLAEAAREMQQKGQPMFLRDETGAEQAFLGEVAALTADADGKRSFFVKDPEGDLIELAVWEG